MLKKNNGLLTCLLLLFAGSLSADFTTEFQEASKLQKKRKYVEAAAAYEKLGKEQKDAKMADLCYLNASKALATGYPDAADRMTAVREKMATLAE